MLQFKTASPDETFSFGQCLAEFAFSGQVVCLSGDLGAGKTLLVQGMAKKLGVQSAVTSPTFTIINVYEGERTLYHFDLYRLEHSLELMDIGYYEYITGDGIAVIEWPDKFPEELPEERLWIDIQRGAIHDERIFTVTAQGQVYDKVCEELKKKCLFLG